MAPRVIVGGASTAGTVRRPRRAGFGPAAQAVTAEPPRYTPSTAQKGRARATRTRRLQCCHSPMLRTPPSWPLGRSRGACTREPRVGETQAAHLLPRQPGHRPSKLAVRCPAARDRAARNRACRSGFCSVVDTRAQPNGCAVPDRTANIKHRSIARHKFRTLVALHEQAPRHAENHVHHARDGSAVGPDHKRAITGRLVTRAAAT